MTVEVLVLVLMWVIGILSFLIITPKDRKRRFLLAFLICQALTWLIALLLVKYNRISYPVREFPKATDIQVTLNYLFYPLICGFYIIFEPKRNYWVRILYLSLWVSGLVLSIVMIEKYTNLITFVHYAWYWSWLNFFCLFTVSNLLYQWFFKDKALLQSDKGATQ